MEGGRLEKALRDRFHVAQSVPAGSQARRRAGQPPSDEVPVVLGELAGDQAPAAEVGRGAPAQAAHTASTSAAMADAPSPPAGLTAGAPSAAPACLGLARRGGRAVRLLSPKDVEVEEEAADLAAARACRGSPTWIVRSSGRRAR